MRLKQRSYPHPVLGNKDDVLSSAFQASLGELRTDRQFYRFTVDFLCSNKTLKSLIAAGKALYLVHVECTNTIFRQKFSTPDNHIEIEISADDLNENVEVNFFICAQTDISGYEPDGSHEHYSGMSFNVNKGDILAVSEGIIFRAVKDYDSVRKISAIMQVEAAADPSEKAMAADFLSNKIRIVLPQEDYQMYDLLKRNPALQHALTCSIVLPTLAEAVRLVKSDQEADDFTGLRWFDVLHARLHEEQLLDENSYLAAAQKLLGYPLNRALKTASEALEND